MTVPPEYVKRHIRSVITLDSPLRGFQERNPISQCDTYSPAWQDIFGSSEVVGTISSIKDQDLLTKFHPINSSPIGNFLQGTQELRVDCSAGGTLGYGLLGTILLEALIPGYGIIGALIGGVAGAYQVGHTCVWVDGVALASLADHINPPQ